MSGPVRRWPGRHTAPLQDEHRQRPGTADMIDNLIAKVAARFGAEPRDLYAATRIAQRLANAPDLPT